MLPRAVLQGLAGLLELSAAEEASATLPGSRHFRVLPVTVAFTAGHRARVRGQTVPF